MGPGWLCAFGVVAVIAPMGCGGGGDGGSPNGGGGGNGGDGAVAGAGGTSGATTSQTGSTATGPASDPCEAKACGAECAVCNDVECLVGECDVEGVCSFDGKPSCGGGGAGAGGGSTADCPPEPGATEPCDDEGAFCPTSKSCSGYLKCLDGKWTLINPC